MSRRPTCGAEIPAPPRLQMRNQVHNQTRARVKGTRFLGGLYYVLTTGQSREVHTTPRREILKK